MSRCVRVSLVATVLNEASSLPDWLGSIGRQSFRPDEVVIVDGGSTDETWQLLTAWSRERPNVACVRLPGANISQGRNAAIERATGDVIVVTDAGTQAHPDWLEQLLRPFDDPGVDMVGGFFEPRQTTSWERALAATTLPDVDDVDSRRFLPSSRSASFRRAWFAAGVQYPEWLDYCEDVVWDLAMRRAGARPAFVPEAVVTFGLRPSPRAYALQYFRYARGDGKAGLFARRHLLRYATYLALAIILARRRLAELAVASLLGAGYIAPLLRRLWRRDRAQGRPVRATLTVAPLVPALRALGDASKMTGYPFGLIWRWRRYGAIGWTTSWRRISPSGSLWRPGSPTRESPLPTSSRGA